MRTWQSRQTTAPRMSAQAPRRCRRCRECRSPRSSERRSSETLCCCSLCNTKKTNQKENKFRGSVYNAHTCLVCWVRSKPGLVDMHVRFGSCTWMSPDDQQLHPSASWTQSLRCAKPTRWWCSLLCRRTVARFSTPRRRCERTRTWCSLRWRNKGGRCGSLRRS